jgi:hypothetical protein
LNPDKQLLQLYESGFTLETFERYPRHVAAIRDNCIALLEVTPTGLRLTGAPGWRMGDLMGVLVEKSGRQVFQAKAEIAEATPERVQALQRFRQLLEQILLPAA